MKKTNSKRSRSVTDNPVIKIKPASLVGAADCIKEIYLKDGYMTEDLTITLFDSVSGETSVSANPLSRGRPRKHASKSLVADAKNRKRREEYRNVRDTRKSPKIPIVSQQVTMTKSGN